MLNKNNTLLIFLFLNFACLWASGLLMGDVPSGNWYSTLERAPWTPPNWAFGVAWSLIMLFFAV